ncbi:MAG: pyridoxal phosphate-dependent aminotransferase [Clostridiales Family XIII bacterium]|jgi:aminotransferase|nr:pyridoxal phosphate-dependent aminotransferase [Clostridiales Family XIII bacterium]
MKELSHKGKLFASSKIREMTILSNKYNGINLAQGFPEFAPPKSLLDSLVQIAQETTDHQYGPNWGTDNLRQAIAQKQNSHYRSALGRDINWEDEVLVTCGSTEAMMATYHAVFNPGDKFIVFTPYYSSYIADAIVVGAEPIFVKLNPPNFDFDYNALERAFAENDPKAIIVCNPSNPSGKVFTKDELEYILRLAQRYDSYIITDEVYDHIVFEPYVYTYLASLEGAFERTIACSSLSKSYSVTGWRLGYIIAPYEILDTIRKFHDLQTVCAPTPLQEAAAVALSYDDTYYDELTELYTRKKDILISGLDAVGLKHTIPQGAYFVLVDIAEFGYASDHDFCVHLVKDYGIAAVPGSSFFQDGNQNYIRFHFAKHDDTLYEVIKRLGTIRADHGL